MLPAALLAQTTDDIRDIRGPKTVAASWAVPAALAATMLAVLCAYVFWRRRQRSRQRPALSLTDRTLERLEGARALMRPETARAFGIAASETIRDYIEQRFGLVATQRTTEEFLQALLQSVNAALAGHRPLLAEFLHQCDRVKFAGDSLAVTDMEALLHSARRFVLETGEASLP
jgi:hypothetical protein